MSRNGSGTFTYTANSVAPAVGSTVIDSTDFNSTMTEIATALTESIAKDGQTVITGALDHNGNEIILDVDGDTSITADTDDQIDFKLGGTDIHTMKTVASAVNGIDLIGSATGNAVDISAAGTDTNIGIEINPKGTGVLDLTTGPFNENKGADIASATTTDIGAATGNFVDVTGTTTITGLGTVKAGTRRIVQFDGSLTLTYNATSLILPGNANIVTQAGDIAEFVSLGSGNWICAKYTPSLYNPASGRIVQVVEATPYATWAGFSTIIPIDDTIPQNTEGSEIITASITPKSTTNRLRITYSCSRLSPANNATTITALFQDTTANALAAGDIYLVANTYGTMYLHHEMEAGTTSSTTFKIRMGPGSATTVYVNGDSTSRKYGGTTSARLWIEEISV